jgi:hypothetical protein
MTVHIFTPPRAYSAAFFTKQGGMQTEAVPYFTPSSITAFISLHVAPWERSVWSVFARISFTSIVLLLNLPDYIIILSFFLLYVNGGAQKATKD